jgi:ribonuclease D
MSFSVSIDESDKCLPFTLDLKDEIKYITSQNLTELEDILSDAYIVGIDTETRPSFYNKKTRFAQYPTSIIQVAVRTKVEQEHAFIIDLLSFGNNDATLHLLNKSLLATMSSSDIVKVGQGLENDLREICTSYPALTAFKDVPSIIDTNKLLRYLQPEIKQDVSLKNLTRNFLHCDLVKTHQCSDWGRRPLSTSQLDYAAGDAVGKSYIYVHAYMYIYIHT